MCPVTFTELCDWSPSGYVNEFVWIAFAERLVATGERNGPENHAGIWRAEDFLVTWSSRLTAHGWEWLAPIIQRLADGDDPAEVEAEARRTYALLHDGATPPSRDWEIEADHYRRGEG